VLNLDQEGSAELTITATLSGSGEVLTISETLTLNPPLTESRIVDGIQSVDIGESADLGVTNYDRSIDAFFVSDHQGTIGNRNDSNRFAYLPVKGDFTLTARLSDFVDTNSESLAGLMVRASTKGNDVQASILISAAGSIRSVIRVEPRKRAIEQSYSTASPDLQYVRISRSGDQVSLETSPDNSNWTIVASNPVPLGSNALLGLAVAAGADSTSPTAIGVFDRVSLEGTIDTGDTGDTGDTTGGGGSTDGGNPNSGKGKKK
jgi:regulation of enolase protein 1 (concanavalin A-like superfamily)